MKSLTERLIAYLVEQMPYLNGWERKFLYSVQGASVERLSQKQKDVLAKLDQKVTFKLNRKRNKKRKTKRIVIFRGGLCNGK